MLQNFGPHMLNRTSRLLNTVLRAASRRASARAVSGSSAQVELLCSSRNSNRALLTTRRRGSAHVLPPFGRCPRRGPRSCTRSRPAFTSSLDSAAPGAPSASRSTTCSPPPTSRSAPRRSPLVMWSYPGAMSVTSGPSDVERGVVAPVPVPSRCSFADRGASGCAPAPRSSPGTPCSHAILTSGRRASSVRRTGLRSFASAMDQPGRRPSPSAEGYVVGAHDLAQLAEVRVPRKFCWWCARHPTSPSASHARGSRCPCDDGRWSARRIRSSTPAWMVM